MLYIVFDSVVGVALLASFSEAATGVEKGGLKIFAKFTGKHQCQSLSFHQVAGLSSYEKKRLWQRCFPVNFAKLLRTPFLQKTSGRLLLSLADYEKFQMWTSFGNQAMWMPK